MYLVAIAWIYVAVMMAAAEATSSQGTVLGAIVTFVLYGVLPVSILVYIMGSGRRRQARRRAEAAAATSAQADGGDHATTQGHAPVGKEP
ncbi:MAG: hypothetical protein IV097_06190 [Burkholderiaceae bacterium]|nr:hypothetical protein [Burkholderiaceae bacterium]